MSESKEWTVETLRELMLLLFEERDKSTGQRFEAQDKAVNAALVSAEKAVSKAEVAAEKRFDAVNEFRSQLSDQAATFMPRTEAEVRLTNLSEQLIEQARARERAEGRGAGLNAGWGYLVGAIGAVGGVIAVIIAVGGK